MKRFIIFCILMLLLLILAVFLMPAADGKAKEVPDDFGERVEAMVKSHKIMTDRLIRYMEHQREEINLLAEVIYHENWHTDKEHLAAYYTGAVVMNRVNSSAWPNTVKKVLYQKGQYSTTKLFFTKEIPDECYDMARDIYKNGTPDVPENVIFQSMQKGLGRGHWKVINGEYFAYG
ncbi:MAG: cell wall hydrolase [Lachnospiraceae bacterium]|nr:cell wall hydrolase [Lachnospiraceae bacterium]